MDFKTVEMKKILVPTDFSECSYYAVEYAANIARRTHGELYLLHIIEAPEMASALTLSNEWLLKDQSYSTDMHSIMNMMEDAKKRMEEYKMRPEMQGIPVVENIEIGNTEDLINSVASRYSIDFIVMCAHGSSGENDFLIGSNAEKMIRGTARPTLTLKNLPPELPENIVFASDFFDDATQAIGPVQEFASTFGARLHFVKINTLERFETTRESRLRFHKFQADTGVQGDLTIYNDVMLENGIINFARETGADVISLAIHNKLGLGHLFMNSLTEGLINHANCPVLTVNLGKE